jgi:hypothetical protein
MTNPSPLNSTMSKMMHEALEQIIHHAEKLEGQMGNVSIAIRHDARLGLHAHASATVRHRVHATVTNPSK